MSGLKRLFAGAPPPLAPSGPASALDAAVRAPVLAALVEAIHDGSVRVGDDGLRFAPDLRSIADLDVEIAMATDLPGDLGPAVGRDAEALRALYRETFDHDAFTGRSWTFFGYEGLGCIYWHMVSKLVLAVQETTWRAVDAGEDAEVVDASGETLDLWFQTNTASGSYGGWTDRCPSELMGNLPVGTYTVRLRHPEYEERDVPFEIVEDEVTQRVFELVRR